MAVSYANRELLSRGTWNQYYVQITLDSSYPSGGESISAADFGMTAILDIMPFSADGYVVEFVRSTDSAWLLKVWPSSTPDTNSALAAPAESSVGRNFSTVVVNALVIGR